MTERYSRIIHSHNGGPALYPDEVVEDDFWSYYAINDSMERKMLFARRVPPLLFSVDDERTSWMTRKRYNLFVTSFIVIGLLFLLFFFTTDMQELSSSVRNLSVMILLAIWIVLGAERVQNFRDERNADQIEVEVAPYSIVSILECSYHYETALVHEKREELFDALKKTRDDPEQCFCEAGEIADQLSELTDQSILTSLRARDSMYKR